MVLCSCFNVRDHHDRLSGNSNGSENRCFSYLYSFFNKVKGIFYKNEVHHLQPQAALTNGGLAAKTLKSNSSHTQLDLKIEHQSSEQTFSGIKILDKTNEILNSSSSPSCAHPDVENEPQILNTTSNFRHLQSEPQSSEQNSSVSIILDEAEIINNTTTSRDDHDYIQSELQSSNKNPCKSIESDHDITTNIQSRFCEDYPSLDEEDECPICLEEYDSENPKIIAECLHAFHLSCIYNWMERSVDCPLCLRVMLFSETD